MEEMFRWLFIGFIAGLRLSLEEVHCDTSQHSNTGGHIMCCNTNSAENNYCYTPCIFNKTHLARPSTNEDHHGDCKDLEDVHPLPHCHKSQYRNPCIGHPNAYGTAFNPSSSSHIQYVCISSQSETEEGLDGDKVRWYCNCNHNCCTLCGEDDSTTTTTIAMTATANPITPAATTHGSTTATNPKTYPNWSTTQKPSNSFPDYQASGSSSSSPLTGQLDSNNSNIILIVILLFVAVLIIVAVVLFVRKRKLKRTNENEAVSSGYEPTVRENHYEPSAEGVPIYTELELTQEPAPSNSTVYSSVQPTGEAVDMGKRVVYAELDNVTVAVSPVYSQPFEAEASGSNTEYTEPFNADNKSTATAPVPNLYDNIAAVDQQSGVYSLAKAIPLSDPSVIYSQPNKPGK